MIALFLILATWAFLASVRSLPYIFVAYAFHVEYECHPCTDHWCHDLVAYRACVNEHCKALSDQEYQFYRLGLCSGSGQVVEHMNSAAAAGSGKVITFYPKEECESEVDETPEPTPTPSSAKPTAGNSTTDIFNTTRLPTTMTTKRPDDPARTAIVDAIDGFRGLFNATNPTKATNATNATTADPTPTNVVNAIDDVLGLVNATNTDPAGADVADAIGSFLGLMKPTSSEPPHEIPASTATEHPDDSASADTKLLDAIAGIFGGAKATNAKKRQERGGPVPSAIGEVVPVIAAIHNDMHKTEQLQDTNAAIPSALGEIAHATSAIYNGINNTDQHHGKSVAAMDEIIAAIQNSTFEEGYHWAQGSIAEHSYVPCAYAPPAIVAYIAAVLVIM